MQIEIIAIRLTKIVMTAGIALWVLIVTLNNVVDFDSNWQFVQHVMAMDTVFPDSELTGRAITNPTIQKAAYILIISVEGLTGLAFLVAAALMALKLRASKAAFQRAKAVTAIGLMLGFSLWFIGFMVIGGEWFVMWQSSDWNGQDAAFMFYMTILAVAIFDFIAPDGVDANKDPDSGQEQQP